MVPIACVEVELSWWSRDILHNGVAAICADLDIPITAYPPLSRGTLTALFEENSDLPEYLRIHCPKLADGALQANNRITEEVLRLAKAKGCSASQIALAWIRSLSGRNGLSAIIPTPGTQKAERVREDCKPLLFNESEM